MEIVQRKNPQTGAQEQWVRTTAQLISAEAESKTSKGGKKYGFFTAKVAGKIATGIVWKGVATQWDLTPGTEVQVEAPLIDLKNGINKNWKLSLPSADSLSQDIADFVANL